MPSMLLLYATLTDNFEGCSAALKPDTLFCGGGMGRVSKPIQSQTTMYRKRLSHFAIGA